MTKRLDVREKSVKSFLLDDLINYEIRDSFGNKSDISAYHILRDEMFFKKDCELNIGDTIVIELFDVSRLEYQKTNNNRGALNPSFACLIHRN